MTWDTTTPAGSDLLSQGDDKIRELKTDLQTALKANDATLGDEGIFPVSVSTPQYRYRGLKGTTAQRPTAGNYGYYWNTTTGTLQRDNGTTWEDVGFPPTFTGNVSITGSITATAGILGSRISLCSMMGPISITSSDFYFNGGSGAAFENSFCMPRPGSITAYGFVCNDVSHSSNITLRLNIQKNGTTIISGNNKTFTTTGIQSDNNNYSIGTNTFLVGDRIASVLHISSAGNITANISSWIEVTFST